MTEDIDGLSLRKFLFVLIIYSFLKIDNKIITMGLMGASWPSDSVEFGISLEFLEH